MTDITGFGYQQGYSPIDARNDMVRKGLFVLESLMIYWLIFHFSGALLNLMLTDHTNLEAENPLMRLLWYPSYLMITGLIVIHFPKFLRVVTFNPLIVISVLICGISYFWSI